MLNLHWRWLDFACTHHRSFCRPWSPSNLADTKAPFFCCHVVEELLVRSIASMFKAHPTARPADTPGAFWSVGKTMRRNPFARLAQAARTTMLCFMMTIVQTLRRRFSTIKQVSGH
jgi:hypothetical protein